MRFIFINLLASFVFCAMSLHGFASLQVNPDLATDDLLAGRLKEHVRILTADSLQGRGLGTQGMDIAREYIADQCKEAGLSWFGDDYFQTFETRIGLAWIPAMNIVGYLEGNDPVLKEEYILIGAHYDHLGFTREHDTKTIFPGADDNASGVAGMLEIARYFAENPQQMKRSLIFVAFDAEESGLRGARHFVENSPVDIDRIKLMFSLDMIGMYEANNGVRLIGMGSLLTGKEMALEVASRRDFSIRSINSRIARRTDTAPFGDIGIPSVHVFTGTKSPYHKPEDTYEKLDYEGMAMIVSFLKELTSELSAAPALAPAPSLQMAATRGPGGRRAEFGITVHSGTGFHRYEDQFFRANAVYAAGVGFYSQITLARIIALQPELLYDLNGSKIEGGTFRRHAVTIPFNIQLLTPGSPGSGRLFAFAGPYYRFNFGGKNAGESIDFDQVFESNEWGISFGAGLQMAPFQISYTSRRGFSNILQNNDLKILDTNNYFTVSLRF